MQLIFARALGFPYLTSDLPAIHSIHPRLPLYHASGIFEPLFSLSLGKIEMTMYGMIGY